MNPVMLVALPLDLRVHGYVALEGLEGVAAHAKALAVGETDILIVRRVGMVIFNANAEREIAAHAFWQVDNRSLAFTKPVASEKGSALCFFGEWLAGVGEHYAAFLSS